MWVMVSGMKRREDVVDALRLGVNAFGLVVEQVQAGDGGFLSPEAAASITKSLPSIGEDSPSIEMKMQRAKSFGKMESLCGYVLVTHITNVRDIVYIADKIGVTIIQLVGDTTSEDVIAIKNKLPYIKVIKSLPVIDYSCINNVKKYTYIVDAIELDTIDIARKRTGGTGKTHDWNISKKIVQEYGRDVPIILAGGLHSYNIEKAIQTVRPSGVDVSSGIKSNRGVQDNEKLEAFIYKARHCESELNERIGQSM